MSTPRALRWKCFDFAGTVWHDQSLGWRANSRIARKSRLLVHRGIVGCHVAKVACGEMHCQSLASPVTGIGIEVVLLLKRKCNSVKANAKESRLKRSALPDSGQKHGSSYTKGHLPDGAQSHERTHTMSVVNNALAPYHQLSARLQSSKKERARVMEPCEGPGTI